MGLFDAVKAATSGNKAYRTHVNGNELANSGKPEEAKAKYQDALKLYEESIRLGNVAAKILEGYAILLLREGEFDKARDLMQRMAKMKTLTKDDWFQLRIQYAIWEWKVGELDKAIETIGRAADYKLNGTVYSTLGMFWVDKAKQTGDFKPALDFNERALDYDDEDAATLDNMGQLYEAMAGAETIAPRPWISSSAPTSKSRARSPRCTIWPACTIRTATTSVPASCFPFATRCISAPSAR